MIKPIRFGEFYSVRGDGVLVGAMARGITLANALKDIPTETFLNFENKDYDGSGKLTKCDTCVTIITGDDAKEYALLKPYVDRDAKFKRLLQGLPLLETTPEIIQAWEAFVQRMNEGSYANQLTPDAVLDSLSNGTFNAKTGTIDYVG